MPCPTLLYVALVKQQLIHKALQGEEAAPALLIKATHTAQTLPEATRLALVPEALCHGSKLTCEPLLWHTPGSGQTLARSSSASA
eukprot:1158266-Pelagomonas_calceolata.AAC.6